MDQPANLIEAVFWVLGGLALFLYGMEMMGKALRKAAGNALRKGLKTLTRTRIHGLLTGAVVTGLVQSSSAATVMVVGFISAGLLKFEQSIGLILGANVGTTVTSQIIVLKLDALAIPFIGVGFLINFVASKRVWRQIGLAVMGFGLLFFGLVLMKFAVSGYSEAIQQWLRTYATSDMRGWILAFGVAMIATAIMQSSSAMVGMIVVLASQGAITSIDIAIPMILGADVGTCITAMLASLKTGKSARRAAVAHLLHNVMGIGITLALFGIYVEWVPKIASDLENQVANCHLAIKGVNALVFLPFTVLFARLVTWIMPGEDQLDASPEYLNLDDTLDLEKVLTNSSKEIQRLCRICTGMVQDAVQAHLQRDEILQIQVRQQEELVDDLNRMIAHYVKESMKTRLPADMTIAPSHLFYLLNHVERIGDHADHIVKLSQTYDGPNARFSAEAQNDINSLMENIYQMSERVHVVMGNPDEDQLREILNYRNNFLEKKQLVLGRHELRLREEQCGPIEDIVFIALLDNLTSVVTHLEQITRSAADWTVRPHHSLKNRL